MSSPSSCPIYPTPIGASSYNTTAFPLETISNYRCTLDELLTQLMNNSSNSITAQDIRDAVYTLWELATEALNTANSITNILYTNSNPIYINNGGIEVGDTFSNVTVEEMWNKLLYPVIPAIVDYNFVSGTDYTKVLDKEIGTSPIIQIKYDITDKGGDYNIISIELDGTVQPLSLSYNGPFTILSPSSVNAIQELELVVEEEIDNGVTIIPNISSFDISIHWKHMILYGRTTSIVTPPVLNNVSTGWLSNSNDYININKTILNSVATPSNIFIALPTIYIPTSGIRIHINGSYMNAFTTLTGSRNGTAYTIFVSDYAYLEPIDFEIK